MRGLSRLFCVWLIGLSAAAFAGAAGGDAGAQPPQTPDPLDGDPIITPPTSETAGPPILTEGGAPGVDRGAPEPDIFERDEYKLTPVVCPFKGEIDYDDENLSCRLLEVPENREKKRGRKIELHVVKLHARKPENWDADKKGDWVKRDDPVIYFTGGPGAKAANYVERFRDHGVRDVRDLYILEQRGIGFSGDYCPLYAGRNRADRNVDTKMKAEDAELAAIEDCFAKARANRVDLSAYSTIENARDARALRMALGYDQWNVWGISYGSILGQAYLKEDPAGVRAAVIDAIVPLYPGATLHNTTKYYARDLDLLAEACDANATCAKHFSDFRERLKAGVEAVAAEPLAVEAIDMETNPSGTAYIFEDLVGGAAFGLLYEQDNYASLPAFIDALMNAVERREAEQFRILSAGSSPIGGSSEGMFNAIACNDGWIEKSATASLEDMAAYPTLSKVLVGALTSPPRLVEEHARICRRYTGGPRDAADYVPVRTDIRTLIVEGEMDPITPPPLAREILPGFANGTYVEFPYAGHGPTRSVECAGDFLTKFYDAPEGELDLSCPESMEAPDFIGPLMETSAVARIGALALDEPKKLLAPGLWAVLSAFALVIAALVYNIAPVARLINGNQALPTGGARVLAWATSVVGVVAIGGLGYAAYATSEANEFLLFLGLLGWARWFALAGLVAGPLGLALLLLTMRARIREPLPIGVLLGLVLTAFGAIGLSTFLIAWGPTPF